MPMTEWRVMSHVCDICGDDDFRSEREIADHYRMHDRLNEHPGDFDQPSEGARP